MIVTPVQLSSLSPFDTGRMIDSSKTLNAYRVSVLTAGGFKHFTSLTTWLPTRGNPIHRIDWKPIPPTKRKGRQRSKR